MSSQQKDSNKRKRLSLQGTQTAQPMAQPMMQPVPWMGNQMWNPAMFMQQGTQQPMAMMAPGPSTSSTRQPDTRPKPWQADSSDSNASDVDDDDDDDDEEDEDEEQEQEEEGLVATKKRKQRARKKKDLQQKASEQKKVPVRNVKKEALAREKAAREAKIVKEYPEELPGPDTYSIQKMDDCDKCGVYVGRIMIKPCGHAKFCQTCINKLRQESIRLNRPAKCLSSECFKLTETWIKIYNVSV